MQERNQFFADTLNARNFAKAEQMGLPILTICSTCQGVMSQANKRMLRDPEYLAKSTATWPRRVSNTRAPPNQSTCCGF